MSGSRSTVALALLSAAAVSAQDHAPKVSETLKAARRQIEEARKAKPPSTSIGTRSNCRLENAAELPEKGVGYRIGVLTRKTHFGTDEMIFGLMEQGAVMFDKHGEEGTFYIGDISAKEGGKLSPHINHQGGRDVDLGLYVCDAHGKPQGNRMMRCDKQGKGEGSLQFDAARNWEFVCAVFENPWFQDRHGILIAQWLKDLLLDHAREQISRLKNPLEIQRLSGLIKKAEKELIQPSSSPHDNHMHLALACTKEDRKAG